MFMYILCMRMNQFECMCDSYKLTLKYEYILT